MMTKPVPGPLCEDTYQGFYKVTRRLCVISDTLQVTPTPVTILCPS